MGESLERLSPEPIYELERSRLLRRKSYDLRRKLIQVTGKIGGAHLGGSFSMMEMAVALYYDFLNIDPANPKKADRDIFILSKGHAGVGLCVLLADRGFFPESELETFNQTGSAFGIHPDRKRIPGVEASTGSLGHGLGLGLGWALAKKMDRRSERVVVMLSDGELCEGSVWEAILSAGHLKTGNLLLIIDNNRMSQDGPMREIMNLDSIPEKLDAFHWAVQQIDGHDMQDVLNSLHRLPDPRTAMQGPPQAIVMDTIKGKGIPWMENTVTWHYGGFDSELEKKALNDLAKSYPEFAGPQEVPR